MGFVDNMLHMESTRAVSSDKSGRLLIKDSNGAPKYKRRKVSAVRDFPPGCGPLPIPILQQNDKAVGVATFENLVDKEKSGNVCIGKLDHVETKGVDPILSFDPVEGLESLKVELLGMSLPKAADALKDAGVIELGGPVKAVKASEPESADALEDVYKVDVTASLEIMVRRKYPPRRRISAVRDFPPFCGSSEPLLNKEDGIEVLASVLKNSLVQEKPVTEENPIKSMVKNIVKETGDDVKDEDLTECGMESFSRMAGDKFQVEPLTTEETRNQDQFGDSSANKMEDEEDRHERGVKSPQEGIQNQHSQKSTAVPKSGKGEIGDQVESVGKDFTFYVEDKNFNRKLTTEETRNQDQFGDSSVSKMADEENQHEKGVKSYQESIQNQHSQKSTTVPKSGKGEIGDWLESLGKNSTVYVEDKSSNRKLSEPSNAENSVFEDLQLASGRKIVYGLMARQNCLWRCGEVVRKHNKLAGDARERNGPEGNIILLRRPKSVAKKKKNELHDSGGTMRKNSSPSIKGKEAMDQMIECDEEDGLEHGEDWDDFGLVAQSHNFAVSLPPFCPSSLSGKGGGNLALCTRNKVREALRLFQAIYRKLLQKEEAKSKELGNGRRRIDLQASKILKDEGKYINIGKQIVGSVPGVEVGDEFIYRVELNIVGLHRQIQGGIDYVKQDGKLLATSIVSSGGYDDDTDNSDVLIYTGSGGNMMKGDKEPEDQKLERGNLALKNSLHAKNPVRVIRGDSRASDSVDARGRKYIYDGLYLLEKFWQEIGSHGKLVFKFKLVRIPGQPELTWKVVTKSKKFKVREGLCVDDSSQGKEIIPICAVNNIDDEKPLPFKYTSNMIYPHWCRRLPPKGCDCINGCSEIWKCSCLEKNGGGIPYNHDGAIVEAKPLVYECGPSCKCPPSCYNRVSQNGIKFQLEIFKTESRGWGVRSLNSIPSGSFICEYTGELLEEREAEQRIGNDEYLFDIGNQCNDNSLWDGLTTLLPEAQAGATVEVQNSGFTIDAALYGNVGRFINHSCSPNLYAQDVLYDHDDRRVPHIMFFAAENIPPLRELTYHYNYMINQVFDSNGNIRKKNCYCGSPECTGRMY